jgi:hypothetical protein
LPAEGYLCQLGALSTKQPKLRTKGRRAERSLCNHTVAYAEVRRVSFLGSWSLSNLLPKGIDYVVADIAGGIP